jgi:glycosyltransferase involved in cell wall biosynthesis
MNNPLISVALCTYNGAKYIKKQLESIINQTYSNIEVIIVDDCSTDETYALVTAYEQHDARIKCYLNDHNLGFNKNFEKALSLTTGQFIAISDQDDIWELNKLQVLHDHIGDAWLAFSNSAYMTEEGKFTGKTLLQSFNMEGKSFISFMVQNHVTGHTTLMSKEFLNYILPFPPKGYYDWWMGFVAMYHHKLKFVDAILTRYRVHAQSVIQREHNIIQNDSSYKKQIGSLQIKQLNILLGYKNLKKVDQKLIKRFITAIEAKNTQGISLLLIGLVNKYYDYLFPDQKPRRGISRLNFAFKYSKG